MIRILIVEDSVTQREILKRILTEDPEFVVAGEARNGRQAVEMVPVCRPDVVLMDIHMPVLNGIEATREIMREHPVPIVVVSATLRKHDVDMAMEALSAGAVSVIAKPEGSSLLHLQEIAVQLREEIRQAAKARVRKRYSRGPARAVARPGPAVRGIGTVDVVGVCASTGGPPVLAEILAALPSPFPVPILLVQHIPKGFEEGFVQWLSETTGQTVRMANHGQHLEPGVWFAAGGRHLTLGGSSRLHLPAGAKEELHCPSGNALFASLAEHGGKRAAGVLLTGMGDDGAEGLLALKRAGGKTLIQNEETCLIWGMPKAAKDLGAGDYELSPAEIVEALKRMAGA